jgi:hypothetical protein
VACLGRLLLSLLICLATGTACRGSPAPPAEASPLATPSVVAPKEGGPLSALDACKPAPSPAADSRVDGLLLPPGAVVTKVERGPRTVTVYGYVQTTPVRIRQYYQQRTDLTVFEIEDEIFEAEAFFATSTHRNYVKARSVCTEGSSLVAVVAPEVKK